MNDTMQGRLPRWLDTSPLSAPRLPAQRMKAAWKEQSESEQRSFHLSSDETERFVRIISQGSRIRRHCDLFEWLNSDIQYFLPHEVLLSAWGDFTGSDVKLDLVSSLPGVRTAQLAHCRVDALVRHVYGRWIDAGRKAILIKACDTAGVHAGCTCPMHESLQAMRGLLVHGMHDKRSGQESLFIAMTSGSFTKGRSVQRFLAFVDPLISQIDAALRRIPALVLPAARQPNEGAALLDLSTRELEVLQDMCRGKTNLEIAGALEISPFTVKNHVQRIFRKIGVTNRTQAAARYAEALSRAREAAPAVVQPAAQPA